MKNFSKIFSFMLLLAMLINLTSFTIKVSDQVTVQSDVCVYVKNNTGHSLILHTGSGTSPMSSGATKKFCLPEGSTLYLADRGRKGKAIVKFTSSMNGKKIMLADFE